MLSKILLLLLPLSLFARSEPFREPWGRDVGLKAPPTEQTAPATPGIATRIADAIIRFHQNVISPVNGPRSNFHPSSSHYMQLAIKRYGFLKGYIMGCDRLLRENDEEWVYRTIEIDGKYYKYDPAIADKL
jgi:hypothetical protein